MFHSCLKSKLAVFSKNMKSFDVVKTLSKYVYPFSQRLSFLVDYAATIVNCKGLFFNFKSFTVLCTLLHLVQCTIPSVYCNVV